MLFVIIQKQILCNWRFFSIISTNSHISIYHQFLEKYIQILQQKQQQQGFLLNQQQKPKLNLQPTSLLVDFPHFAT